MTNDRNTLYCCLVIIAGEFISKDGLMLLLSLSRSYFSFLVCSLGDNNLPLNRINVGYHFVSKNVLF